MNATDPTRSTASTVGLALLCAVVLGSAAALGTIHAPTLEVVTIALGIATALSWWASPPRRVRRAATILVAVALSLTVLTGLQLIPLPPSWVSAISPHTHDVWSAARRLAGTQPFAAMPLSLDPGATRLELLRGVAYALTFLGVMAAVRRDRGRALQSTLALSGAAMLLVAAVHYAFDIKKVYGFYEPRSAATIIAPFLNVNHLASYGNIALIIAFASLLGSRPILPRALLIAISLLCIAADVFSASRGAVISAFAGMCLVAWRSFRRSRPVSSLGVPVMLVIAVGMLALALSPLSAHKLSEFDGSKLEIARNVFARMVPKYFYFGSGRGAFESTFPEFRQGGGFVVWTHPENLCAEWASGWGVPATAVTLALIAYALHPRNLVDRRMLGPWAAIVVIGVQNLADFSLEIPAVGIAAAVCAALVTSGSAQNSQPRRIIDTWGAHPRSVAAFAASIAVVSALGACATNSPDLIDDRARLRHSLLGGDDPTLTLIEAKAATLRHPAEPYFPYAAAVAASRLDKSSMMPWIEQTLRRAPVYPPAHLLLARWLRRRFPAQARLEYRLYASQADSPIDIREIDPLVGSFQDAMELVSPGKDELQTMEALSVRIQQRLPASASQIDRLIRARDPAATPPLLRLAREKLGGLSEPWCEDSHKCLGAALASVEQVEALAPADCEPRILYARILTAEGQWREAVERLGQASSEVSNPVACNKVRAEVAIDARAYDDATAAIDAIVNAPCTGPACLDNLMSAIELETRRGSHSRATVLLARAERICENDQDLARVARAAASAGAHRQAAAIFAQLAARHPTDAALNREAASERASLSPAN